MQIGIYNLEYLISYEWKVMSGQTQCNHWNLNHILQVSSLRIYDELLLLGIRLCAFVTLTQMRDPTKYGCDADREAPLSTKCLNPLLTLSW